MSKLKLIDYCDRTIKFSIYALVFYIPISFPLVEIFAGIAIASWLVKKVILRQGLRGLLANNFLSLPVLSYLLVSLVASFFSSNRVMNFKYVIFNTLEYSLLFFIIAEICNSKSFLRKILIVLIVSATLVAIDGPFQYFTGFDFLRGRTIAIAGHINGPFASHTDFANYIINFVPLVASLIFLKFKRRWLKSTLISILVLLFICLILADTNVYSPPLSLLFWLLLGITAASKNFIL